MSVLFKALKRLSISKKGDQLDKIDGHEAEQEKSTVLLEETQGDKSGHPPETMGPVSSNEKTTNDLRKKVLKPDLILDMKPRKASTFTGI